MEPGFLDDVKQAARAWRGSWLVPAFYLLVAAFAAATVAAMPNPPSECAHKAFGRCPVPLDQLGTYYALTFAALPLAVFQVGMSGTMRVWYLRRFQGQDLAPGDIWALTWKFWGRFFLLGLVLFGFALPWAIAYLVLLADGTSGAALAVLLISTVVTDVLLTFVTPGLALYQPSVGASLRGGLRVLRTTWPACALYALIPPLALSLLGRGAGRGHFKPLAVIGAITGPPLTLLFAGATVAFLLRRFPPLSENGSLGYLPPRSLPDLRVPRA